MSAALLSLAYASLVARLPLDLRVRLRLAELRARSVQRTATNLRDSLVALPWLAESLYSLHQRVGALEGRALDPHTAERAHGLLLDLVREHATRPVWSKRCECKDPAVGPVYHAPRSALFACVKPTRYCTLCNSYVGSTLPMLSGNAVTFDELAWLLERLTAEGGRDA